MGNDPIINKTIERKNPENSPARQFKGEQSPHSPEQPINTKERDAVLHELEESQRQAPARELPAPTAPLAHFTPAEKEYKAVEGILEENLQQLYLDMPVEDRQRFKNAGEATADKIIALVRENGKNIVWKIIRLIADWLSMIPNIKKFYIEQEAKIKADKILEELNVNKYR